MEGGRYEAFTKVMDQSLVFMQEDTRDSGNVFVLGEFSMLDDSDAVVASQVRSDTVLDLTKHSLPRRCGDGRERYDQQ